MTRLSTPPREARVLGVSTSGDADGYVVSHPFKTAVRCNMSRFRLRLHSECISGPEGGIGNKFHRRDTVRLSSAAVSFEDGPRSTMIGAQRGAEIENPPNGHLRAPEA
jgi:hypothetical protein